MDTSYVVFEDEAIRGICHQRIARAMAELLIAWHYSAAGTDCDIWDFAVEADLLRAAGANRTDFRFLMSQGFVRHGVDVGVRRFRECDEMVFHSTSAFVLTEAGRDFAIKFSTENCREYAMHDGSILVGQDDQTQTAGSVRPHWDPSRHELTVGSHLVKRFKWRARNQELVLAAFEEENWAARIDDPLTPQPAQDPKRRLHDTIKCLNRRQVNNLVRFHGDGTGEGVKWVCAGNIQNQ